MVFVLGMSNGTGAAAVADRQPAVWKAQELTFDYQGFTTRYSCDGLRDKVKNTLMALGAHRDLSVTPYGCGGAGGMSEPFPSVRIKLSTLQPAAVGEGASPNTPVDAYWKAVNLSGSGTLGGGDCELAERIRDNILPLFATRNLRAEISCVPHQRTASITLSIDVLVPAE
jgi:hypothetical protein